MIEISGIDVKTGSSLDYASSAVVCGDYDVIVVGGGIAGVAAAVSAARNGACTAVIEPRNFVGGNVADDIEKSTAQSEATRMLPPLMRFLREYIPGFERVHLIDIAPQIGVRETRRIIADHVLTEGEILNDRRFSDTIGLGGYYPDVHPPKGEDKTLASMVYPLRPYEIPFRILVPQGVEGVIVAGRCVSATQRAFGAIRVIPTHGRQAAGTAAALAARNSRSFHDLDIPDLQARLAKSGAFLHPEDADDRFEFTPLAQIAQRRRKLYNL